MLIEFNEVSGKDNSFVDRFHNKMIESDVDFSTGVPCGVLNHFIKRIENDPRIKHIRSQSENEAIGIAAGAYLAGKKPVIYMQNSGFMKSINEITSLLLPYKIPALFLTSYRGYEGETAPQHFINGKITEGIINSLDIPYHILSEGDSEDIVSQSVDVIDREKRPSIILVKRGLNMLKLSETVKSTNADSSLNKVVNQAKVIDYNILNNKHLKRDDSIDIICNTAKDSDAVFFTTGLISRSAYERYDSPNYFYNTGSFGMVSSIGLGFAKSKEQTLSIVVDGDGSVLTNLGSLASIGMHKPGNLVHIVLDNNSYASCSEEKTISDSVKIHEIAKACGYNKIYLVNDANGLEKSINESRCFEGPTMIHVQIDLGGRRDFERPLNLFEITQRFKEHFETK